MRKLILVVLLALLAACGGKKETATVPASWSTQGLTYVYPYNGQKQIAPGAPIVLHFSAPLTDTDLGTLASHFSLTTGSTPVALTAAWAQAADHSGVVLTPAQLLAVGTVYHLNWSGLGISGGGDVKPPAGGVTFTTRGAFKGPRSQVITGPFAVDQMLPSDTTLPLMDFSSLRLQFTQPVDASTLAYGQGLRLEDSTGQLVPATVLLTDRRLTVDPKNDLTPGKVYALKLTAAIKSIYGDTLTPGSYANFTFTPQDSTPRATNVLQIPDSNSGVITSPLTGAAINNVPITSTLLGNNSASQQTGNLYAELAFIPHFPNASPLTVRKNNVLNGSSVTVKIAGQVPAGLNTGAITVRLISDANGYMVANPYSTLVTSPRLVYLTMDVSMAAANASANGAFTQNIPHVEVVGTAIVKDDKLVMDAVGVVELQVLGLDQATGILSFHLESYQDQTHAPAQTADTTPPSLQSWLPNLDAARARPGDPVILNFTKELDPDSVAASGAISFFANGSAENFTTRVDGTSVVLTPQSPLALGGAYQVQLTQQLKDIAGNPLDHAQNLNFTLPTASVPASQSPVALTTYPGYPCATTGRNAGSGQQGTCVGGKAGDDALPIPPLPLNRSIQVRFSQPMSTASIVLGSSCGSGSFRVETLDSGGNCTGVVSGVLSVQPQVLRFTPNAPWTSGQLYRYVLNSTTGTVICDGTQAICGSNGLPLQTQILAQSASSAPAPTAGGPAMEIWFTGAASSATILQSLASLPTSDVNANFVHDSGEIGPVLSNGVYSAVNGAQIIPDTSSHPTASSGFVSGLNIGCDVGSTCPQNQFTYLSAALDAEVVGYDSSLGGIRVLINPTQLIASSVDVYASASIGTVQNPTPTGPQVMRLRYAMDSVTGKRDLPVTGVITDQVDGNGNHYAALSATLEAYLDAPQLNPVITVLGIPITLSHDLHSTPISIQVSGPVSFLPDGRMLATLSNVTGVPVTVNVSAASIPAGALYITIPAGALSMQGVSPPIKQ
jgi:hypothetical protein